ncbi:acyltransferase family protein [Agrobacterium rosae]|uniref:Acyltransferase n=1 Tax=Agrobacterium rosae TaxID=1972867 RepID=A0AAE5RYP2_9HYPH|nr:acyltransferase [Agrobacterium rosae]KAA3511518.1 acyltransferase [Agrobacterium rosae]KAA3519057.1 acyltransferase [Agrobacterium rosae]MDX8330983.1 acyltransferase [Agrobacterium rosae]MQB49201.1 acyltransferase [Agrobacterium rosae]POO51882.1 succinoglycan biosynthesis protein exoh [Agrobacterium rosae]
MTFDQNLSSRINLMRIVLISGIVFVHVPHNPETSPFLGLYGFFDWIRVFLGDALFRVGVPCLSAISGYLLFRRGMSAFDYSATVKSKAKTVLLPFFLWNGALLITVLAMQRVGLGDGYFPDLWNATPREMISHGAALEEFPVNVPLYFLRDLFVCILLSPILAFLVRRAPLLTLGALLVLTAWPDLTLLIVQKKSILFSFTLGIALALYKIDLKTLDPYAIKITVALFAATALLATGLYFTGPEFTFELNLVRNLLAVVGAVGLWASSSLLIQSRIGKRLANTGSLSFWIFCAHYPLLVIMWMIWNKGGPDFYPAFYVGAILLSFVILIISNAQVRAKLPSLYGILTGSRGKKPKAVSQNTPSVKADPLRSSVDTPVPQRQR